MVTVDRAEIEVDAELNESSFRAAAREANAELDKFVDDVSIGADLDDASFLRAAQQANFQLRQTLEAARIEGELDTASFQTAVRRANLELRGVENSIRIGADVDRARFTDSIRSASGVLRNGLARAGDDAGDDFGVNFNRSLTATLVDGAGNIASGFSRALQGGIISSPAIGIGIVTAILAIMPVAGTLAAGTFITAFGAGIAGLGLVFAAQNEQIRASFKQLGSDLAAEMRVIARPLETTLTQVVATIRRTFDALAPELAGAFTTLAPALSVFVRELGQSFENLGPAIQPLTDAFVEILSGIGDRLPDLFTRISDSLINLSNSIDPDQFAALAVGILGIIPAINNMLAGLTQAQQAMQPWFDAIIGAIQQVMPALRELFAAFGGASSASTLFSALGFTVSATATVISTALRIAAAQIRLIRAVVEAVVSFSVGAWNRLAGATRAAWNGIRNTISSVLAAIGGAVSAGWARVTGATSRAWSAVRGAVSAGISAARGAVVAGWNSIASATSGAWARVTGIVSRAVSSVAGLVGRIRNLTSNLWGGLTNGLSSAVGTITSLINGAIGAVNSLINAINRIPAIDLPNIPGFATGVRNFGGGLAVVGERGPELMALPAGSSVFSNSESRRMIAGGAGGGGQTNNLTIINNGPAAGADLLRDITWSLKYAVGAGVRTGVTV